MMNRSQPAPESLVSSGVQMPSPRGSVPVTIFSAILFLSGIGALLFETLWLRLSGLAFGNSVWAAALILSSFMAGLALGNAIAASSRIRRWRPLHLYAVLEVLVALLGCTIVFGLPVLGELLRPVWQIFWNYQPALLGLRFVVSFLILLIPTTAMGLTLPVLMEDPMLRQTNFGRAIGFLYGSNTLGAVVGAVLGEGYLIATLGLRGTSLVAGLAVCLAAIAALLVARIGGDASESNPKPTFPLRLHVSYRLPWRLLFASFGTGCVLLCLEVIWFRFLRLYVVSSATAFAVMLAIVLSGIGLGALLAGAIQGFNRRRTRDTRASHSGATAVRGGSLSVLLLLAAIATLLSYLFFPGEIVSTPAGAFSLASWYQIALLSIALMFPVAFLSGIVFPSIASSVQATVEDRMNSTGVTTLFNTTGAAIGPLFASFVLLPCIGYQWSLVLCAVIYALLGVLVSERSSWSIRRPTGLIITALCAAVILLLAIFPYDRAESHFAHASRPYEIDEHGNVLAHVVKRIEGTSDTYQLLRRDFLGEPYYYRLLTNAFSMSATNPRNQRYMRLFAYLPLALRPEAKDALLICYGCGVTADALLHGPNIKRLDIVDISKEVFRLADFYSGINYSNPLRDPRVRAIVQDGRFFLQASPAAVRYYHGRTASAESRWFSQSLHRRIFFIDEEPAEGGRNRYLLAAHQSTEGGGIKGDSSRVSQCVSQRLGLGQRRSAVDHDGDQRAGTRRQRRGVAAIVERACWAGPGFAAGRRRSSATIGRIVFDGRRGDRSHHAGRCALKGQLSQAADRRGVE